jgi:hypothetical protein
MPKKDIKKLFNAYNKMMETKVNTSEGGTAHNQTGL